MFSLALILAAFGGGVLGALIGALPAFIFTGFIGLIGVGVIAAGGPATILTDVTFGALFGPHIAFAGGVAAAAFAGNKKRYLESGADILTPLNKTNDVSVLLVGGAFGILGYIINAIYVHLALPTDTVALTVFTSGVLVRFIFGNTGLIGEYNTARSEVAATAEASKRKFIPDSKTFSFIVIYSLGLGLVVSYLVDLTQIDVLGFTVSAALLIFVQMGFNIPATHHITLVAGLATMATGNIYIGTLFAIIAGLLNDIVARTFNSNCDTHIDPPATAIFICAFIIFIFM
ncbi:hypothetical protein [Alkaliphilus peptidifermentans]|uniref:DUF7973 domain-containing protein n=1 Tax=Alkaliphilus peptidifermentans DSM 18978 TaxID=1120976 RepID=A0A1G5AAR7_9FIRM|nr:hypothetical protein [Alkaliphilus peptidifermentans]SCX74972.1 hypothetical protein SAMN03080606_00014 [Alkaliphilus peptidifermentans DSM 18978]